MAFGVKNKDVNFKWKHLLSTDLLNVFYVQGTMLDTPVLRQRGIMEIAYTLHEELIFGFALSMWPWANYLILPSLSFIIRMNRDTNNYL